MPDSTDTSTTDPVPPSRSQLLGAALRIEYAGPLASERFTYVERVTALIRSIDLYLFAEAASLSDAELRERVDVIGKAVTACGLAELVLMGVMRLTATPAGRAAAENGATGE